MEVFFYGLFMDENLLRDQGLNPEFPRQARLEGFRLHIGQRATLIRADGHTVYGIVMRLSPEEAKQLYAEPGVADYQPEKVTAIMDDGGQIQATCYNLPPDAVTADSNRDYATKLHALTTKLGFPKHYLSEIARQGGM